MREWLRAEETKIFSIASFSFLFCSKIYVYIYIYSVILLYIPRLMWESFYFSKDCLSRDERRKRKIGKEKERDTFHRGWNPFSNGSFDLSKEKRRKRRGKGIRCARGRHLGEYLCLVFAKHKRGMGMAERERETVFEQRKRRVRKRCLALPSRHEQLHA